MSAETVRDLLYVERAECPRCAWLFTGYVASDGPGLAVQEHTCGRRSCRRSCLTAYRSPDNLELAPRVLGTVVIPTGLPSPREARRAALALFPPHLLAAEEVGRLAARAARFVAVLPASPARPPLRPGAYPLGRSAR